MKSVVAYPNRYHRRRRPRAGPLVGRPRPPPRLHPSSRPPHRRRRHRPAAAVSLSPRPPRGLTQQFSDRNRRSLKGGTSTALRRSTVAVRGPKMTPHPYSGS